MKNGNMEQGKSVHNNPQTFQKVDAHSQRNLIRFRKDGDETVSFRTAPKYSVSQIRLHSSAAAGGRSPEGFRRETRETRGEAGKRRSERGGVREVRRTSQRRGRPTQPGGPLAQPK